MRVAISGRTGSGKTTIAKKLAEETGLKLITATLKDYAAEKGIEVLEFIKQGNQEYDKKMDAWQKKQVQGKDNYILVSWLSASLIAPEAELRIWLDATPEERGKRIEKRDKRENGTQYVRERDKETKERFKKLYGIEYDNPKHYNLTVDTAGKTPEQITRAIIKSLEEMKK